MLIHEDFIIDRRFGREFDEIELIKRYFHFFSFSIHSELEKIGFQSISFFGNRSSKERNEMSIDYVDEIDFQVEIVEFGDRNL
jgi:hypothetical protein